jgi:hypothetical protein
MSVAPNENAPLGIAIKPDAMPDRTDSIVPTRLLETDSVFVPKKSSANAMILFLYE